MDKLIGTLSAQESLRGVLSGKSLLSGGLSVPQQSSTEPYTGEYVWTPSNEEQTIPINGLRATQDITINPIPSNYGLITWDGSTLTVS